MSKSPLWWEVPGHLEVKEHELYISGIKTEELVRKYGTPAYVYNEDRYLQKFRLFRETMKRYADRRFKVHYAMKANSNPTVLRALKVEGACLDTVSPREVEKGIENGFTDILFTGVSVSEEDFECVLRAPSKNWFAEIIRVKL